jgi:cytochrome c oxidase subunit IV
MADEHPTHAHPFQEHAAHGPNFQMYITVFIILCVFTGLSFVFNELARHDIIAYGTSVALIVIVAVLKALCVAAIFMHLRFDWNRLYCIIIPVSIMAVMMMIVLLPDIVIAWHHGFYAEMRQSTAVTQPAQHH